MYMYRVLPSFVSDIGEKSLISSEGSINKRAACERHRFVLGASPFFLALYRSLPPLLCNPPPHGHRDAN